MTTLVTGGSGFIGSYVLRRLVEKGEDAISYSRSPPPEDVVDKVTVETGDVRYLKRIIDVIKRHDVEQIVHTVSLLTVASQTNPVLAFNINAKGTLNVLEAARLTNVKRVAYVSGSSVYGMTEKDKWVTEDYPRNPVTLYGAIKCFCEDLGMNYVKTYGLDWVAVRYPMVYGPERKHGFLSIQHCIEDAVFKKHVKIPSGGDQKYGPVHIKDAANGLVLAIFARGLKHRIFNIGPGTSAMYTLHDLANIVKKFIPEATFDIGPGEVVEEPLRGPLDITRAREELNYEPQYPRLEDGVREFIEILIKRGM